MQLPQFIQRAISFFDKAEANLTAAQQLTQALAKITEHEGTIAGHVKTIGERDSKITELNGKITEAATKMAEKETSAKAELEAEKKRTEEVLAGMGVDPKTIPAGKPDAGAASEGLWSKLDKLKGEEKRAFRLANWAALQATPRPGAK